MRALNSESGHRWWRMWGCALLASLWLCAVSAAASPVQLTFWNFYNPKGDGHYMTQLVDAFNKAHEGRIEVKQAVTPGMNRYYEKLKVALATGTPPDLAIVHSRYLGEFANDVLYDINDLERSTGVTLPAADYASGPWQAAVVDGHRLGVPLDVITSVLLFYNKSLFAQSGLDAPPQDRDAFLIAARKLTNPEKGTWGIWAVNGLGSYRIWFSLLYQQGGMLFDSSRTHATFAGDKGVQALTFWANFVKEGFSPTKNPVFARGKLGMLLSGDWTISQSRTATNLDYGIAEVPKFYDDRSAFANSHNFVLPKQAAMNPAKLRAALTFINWWGQHSITWAQAGHLPARISIARGAGSQLSYLLPMLAQLPYARYSPPVPNIADIESVISPAINSVLFKDNAPAATLKSAATQVNGLLQKQTG